jgi:diguanylate cyclase (GGDEF)-like protein
MREQLTSMLMDLQASSRQMIGIFDSHDVLRYANPAFSEAYDIVPDGLARWVDMMRTNYAKGCGTAVADPNFEAWLASALSRRGKSPFRAFESDLCDGRWIWMTETVQANGWMLCVASDITPLMHDRNAPRQAHGKVLRASPGETLSDIANRGHLLMALEHSLAQGTSKGETLCVASFDLDHFKRINDHYGRAAGDSIIAHFVQQLQACTRRGDTCGRMGGEEFMLVMSGVALEQAQKIIDGLMQSVRLARPLDQWPQQGYTVSAGLAMAQKSESAKALLRRADEALYAAKAAGRDRLECSLITAAPCSYAARNALHLEGTPRHENVADG